MSNNKLLVVYNTCGVLGDSHKPRVTDYGLTAGVVTDWYLDAISSLLNQSLDGCKVVWSSCLNSDECIERLRDKFKSKIEYCIHTQRYTVNVTFNKTVQECVKKFGEFEGYLYIDSGCLLGDDPNTLYKIYNSFVRNSYGILSIQTNTDTGFQGLESRFVNNSEDPQVRDEDYIIPIGKAINLHVSVFSNDLYKKYNTIIPDVFTAYSTESTFGFLCSSVQKRWAIMKDLQIRHLKSLDGATSCHPHFSAVHGNHWNNLVCNRNALDFINDPEAIKAGLGYEECNNIMNHDPNAYDKEGNALYVDDLSNIIKKYLFLTEEELNYNNIEGHFLGE
jgi:hypothetical protein